MTTALTRGTYADGFFDGEYAGEYDRDEGLSITHDVIATAREDARTALNRSWRTYRLGWVRGYRDAVRTLRAGRWGT